MLVLSRYSDASNNNELRSNLAIDNVTVFCYINAEVIDMENELISKKDLLELTGISYGQLYRWKRKLLIPEEWFVRKSTFTGQETFFPRDRILDRIAKIKNMKEDASLDELADILSPTPTDLQVSRSALADGKIVSSAALELYESVSGKGDAFAFGDVLFVYLLDKMLQSGNISGEEGKILLSTLKEHFASFEGQHCDVIFLRKLGVSTCLLVTAPQQIYFDDATRVAGRLSVTSSIEELKTKLVNGGL